MAKLYLQKYVIERNPKNKLFVSKFNGKNKLYIGISREISYISELENGELVFIIKNLNKEGIIHYFENQDNLDFIYFYSNKINKILPSIYLLSNIDNNIHILYNTKTKKSLETYNDQILIKENKILSIKNNNEDNLEIRIIDIDNLDYINSYNILKRNIKM